MRPLAQREKRTIRLGASALGIYLVVLCAVQGWNFVARKHAEYRRLLTEAQSLRHKVELYQSKAKHIQKLMEDFRMDPAKLARASVMGQASAAIQSAALGGGVQIGPVRESPGRPSSKELGSIQLEAAGPAPALLKFVRQTHSLGYPLIIDSLQIGSEPSKPGQIKVNLTIVILDFEQWKQEAPHV
jgi:hypothetical protein